MFRPISATAATLLLLLTPLAGCSSDGSGGDSKSDKSFGDGTQESASADEQDPFAPNVGPRALAVGETRKGPDVAITLHEVKYPYPGKGFQKPEKGKKFFGFRLETCLREDYEDEQILSPIGENFAAVTPDGNEYEQSGSGWQDVPSPQYPEQVEMIPGRCLKGWIVLNLPKGTEVASVLYRNDEGTTEAEWLPK